MKRLILGSLVAFGLISSAFCFDNFPDEDFKFKCVHYGESKNEKNKEALEQLKQRWEIVKADIERKSGDDKCEFNDKKCEKTDSDIEWLVYANEHGMQPANDKFNTRRNFCDTFFSGVELRIRKAYIDLERRGAIGSYNNFKKEMAKCKLSGDKICVEE